MEKDFDRWHRQKPKIDQAHGVVYFHEREIWFCYLGVNIGSEQDGTRKNFLRPRVIFKQFNNEIFLGIPLTKLIKKGKHYLAFSYLQDVQSTAILSQVRLIDGKRLKYKSGTMNQEDFRRLKKSFIDLIG